MHGNSKSAWKFKPCMLVINPALEEVFVSFNYITDRKEKIKERTDDDHGIMRNVIHVIYSIMRASILL